ncbi:hypothetical protein J6590_025196 [Homalodisca vitripennis]|nr:hypothetical protein J6590_025196 [Homalodisca vitripennis]
MSKHPCSICNIGVKYQAIRCSGPCNMWHHSRCLNWSDKKFKNLTTQETMSWVCDKCKPNLETTQTDIEDLESKIHNLSQRNSLDHETSLTLAAEVGNALLSENKILKEKLHQEKNKKSEYHLELEDKVAAAEDLIKDITDENKKLQTEINHLIKKLNNEKKLRDEMTNQAESEKTQFLEQIRELLSCKSTFKDQINKLEEQVRSKTCSTDLLQEQNDILIRSTRSLEQELGEKNSLINKISQNCDQLTDKLCEQARTAREHLQALLKACKPISSTVSSSIKEIDNSEKTILPDNLMLDLTERASQTSTHEFYDLTRRASQTPTKKLNHDLTRRASQTPTKKLNCDSTRRASQTPRKKLNHDLTRIASYTTIKN